MTYLIVTYNRKHSPLHSRSSVRLRVILLPDWGDVGSKRVLRICILALTSRPFSFCSPSSIDATIELTFPVNVDLVILLKSMLEVFGMGQDDGFHPKIVHHKAEGDGVPNMAPKTRGVLTVIVSFEVEPFFKEFVG